MQLINTGLKRFIYFGTVNNIISQLCWFFASFCYFIVFVDTHERYLMEFLTHIISSVTVLTSPLTLEGFCRALDFFSLVTKPLVLYYNHTLHRHNTIVMKLSQ